MMANIAAAHPDLAAKARAACVRNINGSVTARVLQNEERTCLMALHDALKAQGRDMTTYIFDGGLVPKAPGEAELPPAVLRACEAHVVRATGYAIKLAVKPLDASIVAPPPPKDDDVAYGRMKAEFEAARQTAEPRVLPPRAAAAARRLRPAEPRRACHRLRKLGVAVGRCCAAARQPHSPTRTASLRIWCSGPPSGRALCPCCAARKARARTRVHWPHARRRAVRVHRGCEERPARQARDARHARREQAADQPHGLGQHAWQTADQRAPTHLRLRRR